MIVEFIGGPQDGSKVEVVDGTRYLKVAQSPPLSWREMTESPLEAVFTTTELEIFHTRNGRNFVFWTEELQEL